MTTEELMKRIKYYDVLVTGEAELDANKNVIKDAAGKISVKWMRTGNPSADVKAANLGNGRFLQCEFVEVNTEADSKALPGGKVAELGPISMRGVSRNLFESQQRNPFNAIALKIIAGEFTIIKEAVGGTNPIRPVIKINNFVMPGKQTPYSVGFEYYLHQRSRTSHKDEAILAWQYKDGKLVQEKVIRTTGQLFLFGDEIEIEGQLITDAIKSHIQFKVPAALGVREADDHVAAAANEPAGQTVPTI